MDCNTIAGQITLDAIQALGSCTAIELSQMSDELRRIRALYAEVEDSDDLRLIELEWQDTVTDVTGEEL